MTHVPPASLTDLQADLARAAHAERRHYSHCPHALAGSVGECCLAAYDKFIAAEERLAAVRSQIPQRHIHAWDTRYGDWAA